MARFRNREILSILSLMLLMGQVLGGPAVSKEELKTYQDTIIRQLKLDFHREFEKDRIRSKRDSGEMMTLQTQDSLQQEELQVTDKYEQQIESPEPDIAALGSYPISCWTSISVASNHFVLLITNLRQLVLLNFDGKSFDVVLKLSVDDEAYKAKAYRHANSDQIWFVVSHRGDPSSEYQHYVQTYVYDGSGLVKKQTILMDGPADIEVIYGPGSWYMGIGVSKEAGSNHDGEIRLYEWRLTQFDFVGSQDSRGVRSIAMWFFRGILYLAVARSVPGDANYGSSVYSYHRSKKQLTYVQPISTLFASRVIHFVADGNDYVLFLCQDGAHLFWWAIDELISFQLLEQTTSAIDIDSVLLPNGEVALAMAFPDSVALYAEDTQSRYALASRSTFGTAGDVSLSTARFFHRFGSYYYLFLTRQVIAGVEQGKEALVFKMNPTPSSRPDGASLDPLTSCMIALERILKDKQPELDEVASKIDRVWVTDKDQTVTAPVIVRGDVQIANQLDAGSILLTAAVKDLPQLTGPELNLEVLGQRNQLEVMKADAEHFVYKSKEQIIYGPLSFLTPPIIRNGHLGPLALPEFLLNGQSFNRLVQATLKDTVHPQVFNGDLTVHGDVRTSRFSTTGSLNGIFTGDLMLLNSPEYLVKGDWVFGHLSSESVTLSEGGTINGLRPESLVLNNDQLPLGVIEGVKTFDHLTLLQEVVVRGTTNGVKLVEIPDRVVSVSGDSGILSNYRFSHPLVIDGDVVVRDLINGHIDLGLLANQALLNQNGQELTGRQVFKGPVFVDGDVTVDGLTNGIDFDSVLTTDTPQAVGGHLIFNQPVHFKGDLQTGLVNGIPLAEEVVRADVGPQTVTGYKRFLGNVAVDGHLTATDGATINGIDLSELSRSVVTPENFTFSGTTVFHDLSVQYVDKVFTVNGVGNPEVGSTLWWKSADQAVPVPLQLIHPPVVAAALEIGDWKGFNLERDFLHTSGDEEVTGVTNFADHFYVETPLQIRESVTINAYDVSEYNRSFLTPDQPSWEIHGAKTFPSLHVQGNVLIRGSLNGLKLSRDFLLKNVHQDIDGYYDFKFPTTGITGNLFVDSMQVDLDISGLDFSEFAKEVVMLDDTRGIPIEHKHFQGGLRANNVNTLGLVDGVDVEAFRQHAVPLKSDGVMSVAHNFSDLEFQGPVYTNRINGYPFEEFFNRLVFPEEPVIRGPKTIAGSLRVTGDLAYDGFLNGINLPEFLSRVAFTNRDNVFSAPVNFLGGLAVDNMLVSPHASVDGIPWSELVRLDADESLGGYNRFLEDAIVEGNVFVGGLVDGVDLNSLASNAIYSNAESQEITGSVTVGHLVVNGNLQVVNGFGINGVDLETLARTMVMKSEDDQELSGPVHFRKGLTVDSLIGNVVINGVDLNGLLSDAVSRTVPQTINGHKQFLHPEGLAIGGLRVEGDLNPAGLINNLNVPGVHEAAILAAAESQEVDGTKSFRNVALKGDLFVAGTVNGLRVPEDLVLKSTSEEILVPVHMVRTTDVQGDLVFLSSVDGVDLEALINKRVSLAHNEVFSADVTFEDKVNIDWLEVLGSINDIPASSIVLRSQDLRIGGKKVITGNVYVNADFQGETVNGINLPEMLSEVVRHDRHEVITGPTVFLHPVHVRRDVIVETRINGAPLDGIRERYMDYWRSLSENTGRLTAMTESQEYQVRNQFQAQKQGSISFGHFDLIQTLNYAMTRLFTYPAYQSLSMDPSVLLYGWSERDCDHDGECCAFTTSVFSLDSRGLPSVISVEQNGRLIPVDFKLPSGYPSETFHFWTNTTTHAYDCVTPSRVVEESAIVSRGHGPYMVIPNSPFVRDVVSFDTEGFHFLVVAFSFDKYSGKPGILEVYKYELSSDVWSLHQNIAAPGVVDLDLTTVNGELFLAMAATKPGVTTVFKWDGEQFGVLNILPSSWPQCVLWVRVDSRLFLALGSERYVDYDDIPVSTEPIVIYQYLSDSKTLEWFQHVSVRGAVDITSFQLGGETYLVSASRADQMVSVIQWKGYSGFKLKDEFPVNLVNDLQLFWSTNRELFLVISTGDCRTLVLKASIIGRGLSPLDGLPYYPDYDLFVRENRALTPGMSYQPLF